MPKKKPNVKTRTAVKPPASLMLCLLRSAVISVGCGMALLLILCAVLLSTEDPNAYARIAAMLIPPPISVLCGVLSAKQSSIGGLPAGVLGGVLLCVLLLALGAVIPAADTTVQPTVLQLPIRAAACILLSAIGGYCVTHRKPRARRKHP